MPPKFGDFEAQRHWMEITTNLPISEWYVNSTNNDLNYWGLDYPPLTAYHSFIVGKISEMIHPEWTALHTSRGITNDYHKLFMRMSVMVTFVALYIPALWLLLKNAKSEVLLAALLYPGLMLIDNGHFQYNHISLGLFLWAVYFFFKNKPAYGSVAFVLALSFKQMELYHAIPIFAYLLGRSLFYGPLTLRPIKSIIYHLAKLGICVIITFAVVWAPFVYSKDGPLQVLGRIFPFYRGLFEDKVANFWCCSSVVFKFKDLLTIHQLLRASTGLVLLSVIPTFFTLLLNPSKTCFLMGLLNSSLSFFLFSFQVHEKSILLAAIPALLLLQEERLLMTTLLSVTNISLFPLLLKDGVVSALPYSIAYHCVFQNNVSIVSSS
ncbi:hypothetical protein QR680_000201 [Steinernema hermaphroditum]|uniref:Alpha-1,3-glucosyltransferase n=1 Tax=Steinernema hermaphroditum TaxID=289476 RepID=A0AA39GWJ1_9BILA|nr:hypothetical protein QR680_000201 [Steinernema hermaphroditum]